ncbi:glycosyltransferase [Pseudomonas sp.]|uniref:glycosyltransferase n=1 Tax=Pseudomonas sp. TaxID=306 RepID=UPI002611D0F3|nr:glycosyltransferase [Pseudomonas sp.]
MKILHLINSAEIKRGGAQKILHQITLASPETQEVFGIFHTQDSNTRMNNLLWPFRLLRRIIVSRPSIVVAHSRIFLPAIFALEKFTSIKTVFICHNLFIDKHWFFRFFKIKNYVAISNTVKEYLSAYISPNSITTIFNGTHFNSSTKLEDCSSDEQTFQVAYIGSLNKVKGVDIAISALNSFTNSTGRKVVFHVVGDGPEIDSLKSQAAAGHISVLFHGYSENPFSLIKKVGLVLIPSLYEGFCLVLVESIINGKAVFASDLPVLIEVAAGVSTVRHFPTGSESGLLRLLIDHSTPLPPREERLKSSLIASELYSLERMQKNYINYFKSI